MQVGHVEARIQQGTNVKSEYIFTTTSLRIVSILNINFITLTPNYSSIEVILKKLHYSLVVINVSLYHKVLITASVILFPLEPLVRSVDLADETCSKVLHLPIENIDNYSFYDRQDKV